MDRIKTEVFQCLDGNIRYMKDPRLNHRVDIDIFMEGIVDMRIVYRRDCCHHHMNAAVDIQHLWVDESVRRQGVASSILLFIEQWFKQSKIPMFGIYVLQDMADRLQGVKELIDHVGKDRMNLEKSREIHGYLIQQ
jgi:GNAT superfamily N-acetyltransferase